MGVACGLIWPIHLKSKHQISNDTLWYALNARNWNLYYVTFSESDLFPQRYDVHQLKRSPNDCIKRRRNLLNVEPDSLLLDVRWQNSVDQEVHGRIWWVGGKRLFIEKLQWKSVVDCNLLQVFPCRKETQTLQEMALYFEKFRKYPKWKLHKCHFSVLQQPEVRNTICDIGAYADVMPSSNYICSSSTVFRYLVVFCCSPLGWNT